MIQYGTREDLRSFAAELGIVGTARLRKGAASGSLEGSTFLSHSSKDDDLVAGAINVLENHGAKVYVDEIDPEMPPHTTEKTAALL